MKRSNSILLFNKPYRVVSQFTDDAGHDTLAHFIPILDIYAAGRLDFDSEGLLVLTGDGKIQAAISHPKNRITKTYWAQVEGIPDDNALETLRKGIVIQGDYMTQPCQVRIIEEPATLWERNPPIRYRANIPTCWLEIKISEGKNRQVRKMTAAMGHPTLRLIRYAIGHWTIDDLMPGKYRWATYE